ncbi:hypothetical protein [Dichotomicrobium thermohalophilum]|uniref:Uncharacterized protein n=1 Tax=Dichotomicrobium thermohalophilum TaxID=933063 RepID=A0A397Q988_9HYPH|nr:hypothetical protein [Dichotomicrobium thermohalophilum]RIA56087.1 hypothetical protein BXY53_1184 [Dichotomicrobium thermohalophilum]
MNSVRTLMVAAALLSLAGEARASSYCRTVIGEVEGFGQDYTRFSAERNREKAIEAELGRWREMRREVVSIEREETACEAVYPLGFEEWYCVAKADVCVKR